MGSIYNNTGNSFPANAMYNPSRQVVIPQITIPSGFNVQQYEPLTAHGKDAAYRMYTPPGVRVPIFDDEEEIFYYKETDVNGNIVAFDTYCYSKVVEAPPPQYLTVEEFNKFKEELLNGQSIRSQGQRNNRSYNNGNNSNKPAADTNSK